MRFHAHQLRNAIGLAEEAGKLVEHDVEVNRLATIPGAGKVQSARSPAEVQALDNFPKEGTLARYAGSAPAKVQRGRTLKTAGPG